VLTQDGDGFIDSDDSDVDSDEHEDVAVLEVMQASQYLAARGISLNEDASSADYLFVAMAVMEMDDAANKTSWRDSDSDSGDDSEYDFNRIQEDPEAEVLDAFRYLTSQGISLDDSKFTDVSQYVKIANAIRRRLH
jgi:hypothetical protein